MTTLLSRTQRPSIRFIVDPNLLKAAKKNNSSALFQIGFQALCERRYGYALLFFNFAQKNGHYWAKQFLSETRKQLLSEADKKVQKNLHSHTKIKKTKTEYSQ